MFTKFCGYIALAAVGLAGLYLVTYVVLRVLIWLLEEYRRNKD